VQSLAFGTTASGRNEARSTHCSPEISHFFLKLRPKNSRLLEYPEGIMRAGGMKTKLAKAAFDSSARLSWIVIVLIASVALASAFNLAGRPSNPLPQSASNSAAKPAPPQTTLSFAERVAYQRAIEEVYWRHRIWPKENTGSKPPLGAVMTQARLEKKVTDYLRASQALEHRWQRPITAEQLQAEMDRMAQHTKQPEVLHELFEALGNDPFVIAECLARPVLSARLVAKFSDNDGSLHGELTGESRPPKRMETARVNYTLPEISSPSGTCTDDTWTPTNTTNAPDGREFHTAVWTGSEMIVWGGYNGSALNTGGRYNPSTDSWTGTSTTNAPSARSNHTSVWTGSEMIIWGGGDGPTYFNTGGRYNPATDSWMPTSTTNAPEARDAHTAVWTGSEMIIWGGFFFNTGGRYNPNTDSWTATSVTNAPTARYAHTAVWTGGEMIVWGGYDGSNDVNTGGRYNPSTDSWTATSISNAPMRRELHTAVWTDNEMIVWGGYLVGQGSLNTGGTYDPNTDTWTTTNTTNAPSARYYHTAVWTGSETIIWGGTAGLSYLNTGGRYNPGTDSWTATRTINAPAGRYAHTAEWMSTEMIIWGGVGQVTYLNTGGRYCAQFAAQSPTPTPTVTPTLTATATATATFTATPAATATSTPTPTTTPRPSPTPRLRPTAPPRPTPSL